MAGVSTPLLAASVCEAGGLGSIGVGATDAAGARAMIEEVRGRTNRAFNVNLFVHGTPKADPERETAWLEWLAPLFAEFGAEPPATLRTIYRSFADDPDMLAMLLELAPPVVSFHFGLPPADVLSALRARGIYLIATATSLDEAAAIEAAGIDAIVAQGIEAGGHRGVFDPAAPDDALGTLALTRLLVRATRLPIVASGGIMDGAGIAAALDLGAVAAQLGTAFVACRGVCRGRRLSHRPDRAGGVSHDAHVAHLRPTRASAGQPFHGTRRSSRRTHPARLPDRL